MSEHDRNLLATINTTLEKLIQYLEKPKKAERIKPLSRPSRWKENWRRYHHR